jgi:hypothetical protein
MRKKEKCKFMQYGGFCNRKSKVSYFNRKNRCPYNNKLKCKSYNEMLVDIDLIEENAPEVKETRLLDKLKGLVKI